MLNIERVPRHEFGNEMKSRKKVRTCVLLILLFGKNLENLQMLSGEQIRSSHFFLPLSSKMGREEKSSSQVSEVGGPLSSSLDVLVEVSSNVSASTSLARLKICNLARIFIQSKKLVTEPQLTLQFKHLLSVEKTELSMHNSWIK